MARARKLTVTIFHDLDCDIFYTGVNGDCEAFPTLREAERAACWMLSKGWHDGTHKGNRAVGGFHMAERIKKVSAVTLTNPEAA
jgi:hypothetical protein